MNSSSSEQTWQHLVDSKARDLHEQIAAAYIWTKQNAGEDEELFRNLTRQQYDWLRNLYEHELPLAKLLDEADLTVEIRGPATRIAHPRLSIVSSMFTDVRKHVAQVTKAVAGVRDPLHDEKPFHMPTEMELGFSSLVHNGTVRFGFTLPRPEETLLQADDPLFQAVTRAVKAIRSVSFSLSQFDSEAEVEAKVKEELTDPKLRDSALIAVRQLAPSGRRSGIEGITIAGGGVQLSEIKPLTKESRQTVRHILAAPVKELEVITVSGTVRETDLDDKRFEIRGIEAGQLTDLRCIYGSQVADRIASVWLNQKVEVKGRVERDSKGRARLMRVTHLRLLDAQPEHTGQSEFEFPEDV
jgi:hypothetical protein